MKYTITRIWHDIAPDGERREIIAEGVTISDALDAILDEEAANAEAEARIRDNCMKTASAWLYDFRDYTYKVEINTAA